MGERRAIWAGSAAPSSIRAYMLALAQTPLWTEWNMRHIPTHRSGSAARKVMVFARAVLTLTVVMARARPDVVHVHAVSKRGSMFRGRLVALVCRAFRVPVILDVHPIDTVDELDWRRLDALYREASHAHRSS